VEGGGGQQGSAVARLLTKTCPNRHQNVIFYVMSEAQKDSEDISAGKGVFLYKIQYMTILSRIWRQSWWVSTLTSPGTIKIKGTLDWYFLPLVFFIQKPHGALIPNQNYIWI
jgi:hypothetical protein